MVDNIDVSFMSHSPFVTIEQGVQGDAVSLPGRVVSPPFPLLFRVPPQAA